MPVQGCTLLSHLQGLLEKFQLVSEHAWNPNVTYRVHKTLSFERETERQIDRQKDRRTYRQTDRRTDRRADGRTERRTDGRREGRTDGQTDTWIDIQLFNSFQAAESFFRS